MTCIGAGTHIKGDGMTTTHTAELDVLVIGAGFAGIYQLDRLRDLGYNVQLWEAGAGPGGIWYWNCYPGARVDSEGAIYQFAYKELWKNWRYRELFPGWAEMRDYFRYVVDALDLDRSISYNRRVVSAVFDETNHRWVVQAEDGSTVRARFLVPCTGFGSSPHYPDYPGIADGAFTGEAGIHHTARWPQGDIDMTGLRVAVIGTGASGVQVAQEAAKVASEVYVFQRTPNTAFPMKQKQLTDAEQDELQVDIGERLARRLTTFAGFDYDFIPENAADLDPDTRTQRYEALWEHGGFRFWLATFQDILVDPKANDTAYAFWRDRVRARVKDPIVAAKLAPTEPIHPFGVKRPSLEQTYFDIFNQDNVHLVDQYETPIAEITSKGVRTSDAEYEVDLVVLATGFDSVTGGLTAIDIRGVGGQSLKEKWEDGFANHLGVTTKGFPNLLFAYGPGSPAAFCNGPMCAEAQGERIVQAIEYVTRGGHSRIESTDEADERWRQLEEDIVNASLFPQGKSWYMGDNIPGKKRQMLLYTGGLTSYLGEWESSVQADYAGFTIS